MSLVVPFDSSELSRTALVRATQFDQVLEQGVVVITAIPKNKTSYARERGWLGDEEAYDHKTIISRIEAECKEISPDAAFEYITCSRYAQAGEIASKLRRAARAHDASIVFVGSENAGRVVRAISVGKTLSADDAYDTMIISRAAPSKIDTFEEIDP